MLPTPRASGGSSTETVRLLPTPAAADGDRTSNAYPGGNPTLPGARSDELLLKGIAQWGKYWRAIERWESVAGPVPAPTVSGRTGQPKLNKAFTEWMMGLPSGWITETPGVTDNEALRMCGNGVVPQQAAEGIRWCLDRLLEATA